MEEGRKKSLQKVIKKNIVWMVIGIILIVLSLGAWSWAYVLVKAPMNDPIDLSILTNEGKEAPGKYVKLNIQTLSDSFAVYSYEGQEDKSDDKLYLATDGNFIYVVEMKNELFNKLKDIYDYTYRQTDDIAKPEPATVKGMTTTIDNDMKKLIINGYNEIMQEEFLTEENFSEYIGTIYLNTLARPIANAQWQILGGFIGMIIGITLCCIYTSRVINTRMTLKQYEKSEELDNVYQEIEDENTKEYVKNKLFLTSHYILDYAKGIQIIKYTDIMWIYPYELRRNGITTLKQITVMSENSSKRYRIANFAGSKDENSFNEVYDFICDKSPNSLKGYTLENKKEMLERRKHKA